MKHALGESYASYKASTLLRGQAVGISQFTQPALSTDFLPLVTSVENSEALETKWLVNWAASELVLGVSEVTPILPA